MSVHVINIAGVIRHYTIRIQGTGLRSTIVFCRREAIKLDWELHPYQHSYYIPMDSTFLTTSSLSSAFSTSEVLQSFSNPWRPFACFRAYQVNWYLLHWATWKIYICWPLSSKQNFDISIFQETSPSSSISLIPCASSSDTLCKHIVSNFSCFLTSSIYPGFLSLKYNSNRSFLL